MIVLRVALLPARALATSFRLGYRTGRLVGYRRLALLGAGVGAGLLLAPMSGPELRAALRRRLEGSSRDAAGGAAPSGDGELAERVRFELSHHPRTWHLPQPAVSVSAGRVTLEGDVPDEPARSQLVEAAASLAGVGGVEDRLRVVGTPATS